ncbi:MAG: C39 family peptidase [Clostridiales bacterium]|nr:C39 family peptidase [Clostridiales bacterium]
MDNHSIKNTNSKKVHIIGTILIVLFVIFSIIMIIMTNPSKKNRSAKETDLPEEYVIQTENYFDYQEAYDCSGYSTAYVLRSLGIDVKGHELYEKIPQKFADGTVPIESIMNYLQNEGYEVNVCSGSIENLKKELYKGVPVVSFVRMIPNTEYYHYIAIVGYGKDVIYAVDSERGQVNTENEYYNRVIKNEDFLNMCDTGFYEKNTYITIGLKKRSETYDKSLFCTSCSARS